eukprot:TRINITY_DN109317_c0_g1_i1.p2 TRINITY_DN109317_c0_g1~~TRINITY_DN109317_c0_g1_i1.p2  ORF type:complete len:187 (+),score=49.41 TRINITY_DN109317_c0_g1_i1:75-635(+)
MDAHTLKKRQDDKICAQSLNSPGAQKIKAVNARRAELLREQKELAKSLRVKVGEDIAVQYLNVKAQQVAVKKSKEFGPVEYRHNKPPSETSPEGIPHSLQQLLRVSNELDTLQQEAIQLEKQERLSWQSGDKVHCDTLGAWFTKYGEPKRKSVPEERFRSFVKSPRRVPFMGMSNAQTLRKGHLIS